MSRNAEKATPACLLTLALLAAGCAGAGGGPAGGIVEAAERPGAGVELRAQAPIETWVDSVVTEHMVEDRIPGAAVVWVDGGEVVLSKGYGVADVEALRPVTAAGTVFRIGSITKVVTAMALTRLVDEGQVELDAPVGRYVDGLAVTGPGGEPILVRHLLSHSGGFDQIGEDRQVEDPAERPGIRAFLERELVPVRAPGSVGVYDTYGITLAGHLVERVSGRSYARYVEEEVFGPLGMSDSWVEVPEGSRDRLARGYGLEDGVLEPQAYEWYVTLPASSVDATAADMGRFLVALLGDGGGLLSASMAERVRTERMLAYGDMGAFSWGFWEAERSGHRALHHGGIMRGYSSELYLAPGAGAGFYVAYNRDPETGSPPGLRDALTALLHERILEGVGDGTGAPDAPAVAADASRLEGAYGNTVACFTCAEGEGWPIPTMVATAEAPGVFSLYGGTARFLASDTLVYLSERSGREVRFLTDARGRVRYLVQGANSFAKLDSVLLAEVIGADWRDRPVHPLTARVYRANEQWDRAADAYGELARTAPDNGRFAFYEGFSHLHVGAWPSARRAFERALAAGQWPGWSQYYVAASHAGAGDAEGAWSALEEALELGFSDANLLRTEPWWDGLRDADDYQRFMERLGG